MLHIQLLGCCIVKPHEQLVLVSFTYHYASRVLLDAEAFSKSVTDWAELNLTLSVHFS